MLAAIDAAALLHDIGKLGIPDRLLHKPGPLTPDEYDQVKQHAIIGADILSAMAFPGPLALIVRHHHENWDGTGYPDGLRGEAIPIGARVLAIVDCYDALTSDRPYRRALSHERAVAMIRRAPRDDVRPGDRGRVSPDRRAAAIRPRQGARRHAPRTCGSAATAGEGDVSALKSDLPTFALLPSAARAYVVAVVVPAPPVWSPRR